MRLVGAGGAGYCGLVAGCCSVVTLSVSYAVGGGPGPEAGMPPPHSAPRAGQTLK